MGKAEEVDVGMVDVDVDVVAVVEMGVETLLKLRKQEKKKQEKKLEKKLDQTMDVRHCSRKTARQLAGFPPTTVQCSSRVQCCSK